VLLGFSQTVARRFLIRSPGGALVRLMKFGKRFLAAQRAEYVYLDYKALKRLIKNMSTGAYSSEAKERLEVEFQQELHNSITSVNSFFVDKERQLLEQLPDANASASGRPAFFNEASDLYAFCVLNYLAALKILKKHDKHNTTPVREQVVEHIFNQAFYLSLEHSYLYSACRAYLADQPPQKAPRPLSSSSLLHTRTHSHSYFGRSALRRDNTLKVPVHFEQCLMGADFAALDFAALRQKQSEPGPGPSDFRNVEMQIEMLLSFAGAPARLQPKWIDEKLAARNTVAGPDGPPSSTTAPSTMPSTTRPVRASSPSLPSTVPSRAVIGPLEGMAEGMAEGSEWAEVLFSQVSTRRARDADPPVESSHEREPKALCVPTAVGSTDVPPTESAEEAFWSKSPAHALVGTATDSLTPFSDDDDDEPMFEIEIE